MFACVYYKQSYERFLFMTAFISRIIRRFVTRTFFQIKSRDARYWFRCYYRFSRFAN